MRPALPVALAVLALLACAGSDHQDVILATTTSTYDSGLLDELLPLFEGRSGYRVKPVAVGTGEALAMGGRGDADVLLTHAPALELELVASGAAHNRRRVMHNDFLIVGPASDPAGIAGSTAAAPALRRLAESGALFVSRGDRSGTHARELALWKQAGVRPTNTLETGQGMAATLLVAANRAGYTLTDRGTQLALADETGLVALVEGDPGLLNVYSVMEVDAGRFPHVHAEAARALADFLVGPEAQARIRDFGVERFGQPLFFPLEAGGGGDPRS